MRVRGSAAIAVLMLVVPLTVATPAAAAPTPVVSPPLPAADLAVTASDAGRDGQVGDSVLIPFVTHNYGPGTLYGGTWSYEATAPTGTTFTDFDLRGITPPRCQILVPHQRFRCRGDGMLYPDNDNPSGVPGGAQGWLQVTITARCPGLGSYKLIYDADPHPGNNTATLSVRVLGVPASECRPKPTPSRVVPQHSTMDTSPSATASTTAAAAAIASTPPSEVATTAAPEPTAAAVLTSGAGGFPWFGYAILAAIAVAALASGLLWRRRRSGVPTQPLDLD